MKMNSTLDCTKTGKLTACLCSKNCLKKFLSRFFRISFTKHKKNSCFARFVFVSRGGGRFVARGMGFI
jgi:hypothetical protein